MINDINLLMVGYLQLFYKVLQHVARGFGSSLADNRREEQPLVLLANVDSGLSVSFVGANLCILKGAPVVIDAEHLK